MIGSKSPREYIDLSGKPSKSLAVKTKKKETFINELEKRVKNIPGPGKYELNPEDKQYAKKVYKKLDFKVEEKKTKKDFIEQVIKEKKGIPGVGKYELYPDNTERERQRHSILGEKARKKAGIFKQTIFDDVHVDCINVAPGSYQTQGVRFASYLVSTQSQQVQSRAYRIASGKEGKREAQTIQFSSEIARSSDLSSHSQHLRNL